MYVVLLQALLLSNSSENKLKFQNASIDGEKDTTKALNDEKS